MVPRLKLLKLGRRRGRGGALARCMRDGQVSGRVVLAGCGRGEPVPRLCSLDSV